MARMILDRRNIPASYVHQLRRETTLTRDGYKVCTFRLRVCKICSKMMKENEEGQSWTQGYRRTKVWALRHNVQDPTRIICALYTDLFL